MKNDSNYIFVYGTLRDPSVNHKAHFLNSNAQLVGEATINAKLFKVSWYPAIVLSNNEAEKVHGEIYELEQINKEVVLHELDGYEGIYDTNEASEEYERILTEATLKNGKKYTCWVYNYKASVENAMQIKSGDYLHFLITQRN